MDELEDNGPDAKLLWGVSWLLGVAAGGVFLRLLFYVDADRLGAGFFLWLALMLALVVFSAAAAVVNGIKNAENRTASRLRAVLDREP